MLTVDYGTLELHAGDRLLDIGCGFGRHSYEALRRGADVVSSDFSMDELHEVDGTVEAMRDAGELPAGARSSSCNGDVTSLPFPDASFDRIIASEVLEHIDDDIAALVELVRILRPGGTFAATVPAALPEKVCWKITDEYHAPKVKGGHVRIYESGELARRMQAAGLDIYKDHRAHALHTPYWWLRCVIGPQEDPAAHGLTRPMHRLLEWDIMTQPAITQVADRILNPVLGKSLIVYGRKPIRSTPR